ncbi:MAG: dihydrodipicolinate synthase family protein [Chloroflexi bacterium]|nr:dihydrodipicolinate synthase family protein [Chloroflexota bacterium]
MVASPFPAGVWPPMLTPLTADNRIDWPAVDRLTDWYLEAGVAGLFAVAQSSEMFALDDAERLDLAGRVVRRVAGRVPVVASGTFDRSVAAQADFIGRLADTGVAAVTVLSGMMAEPVEDDATWRGRVEDLLRLTDPLPLALYECPAPYHRLLPPDLVAWAASTGRFHLLKETSRSVEQVRAKVQAARGTPLGIYNADATTLLDSLRDGARGYCGIAANVYPTLLVRLCATFATAPEDAERLQMFLTVADVVVHTGYPVTAKTFLREAGLDLLPLSRVSTFAVSDYHRRVLAALALHVRAQR